MMSKISIKLIHYPVFSFFLLSLYCFNTQASRGLEGQASKSGNNVYRSLPFEVTSFSNEDPLGPMSKEKGVEEDEVVEMVVTSSKGPFSITQVSAPLEDYGRPIRGGGGGTNPVEVIKAIVALGERAWDLIIQGKPVVRSNHIPISVLPQVKGRDIIPMDLERWSLPKSKIFSFSAKGRSGRDLVQFDYAVHFTYGGQFNGKGKFLAAVNIAPTKIKVKWGQNFDSHTELLEVVNHGTKENPVVSALMKVTYTIRSMTKTTQASEMYHIIGDGRVIPLQ